MLKFHKLFSKFPINVLSWWKPKRDKYSIVRPGKVSAERLVPDLIKKPPYLTQMLDTSSSKIVIKTKDEIQFMRDVCHLARRILNQTSQYIKPGITTDEIDRILHDIVVQNEAYPSPLLYKGFPKSCCTSVNNVALHGIPDDRPLANGDIVNLDVTIYKYGFHGDLSETYAVGQVDESAKNLISATRKALNEAVSICRPGANFALIGRTIEAALDGTKCTVIPQICGHGIGRVFHEVPDIIHVDYDCNLVMRPGMVFTIEPCVSEGGTELQLMSDGWTYVTSDSSRSAQFEHTIVITHSGHEILTADID